MLKGACIRYKSKGLLKRRIFRLVVISFAFLSLFSPGNAPAAEGQGGPKDYSELLSKAQAAGSVRIIVSLDMPFVPEGLLSTSQEAVDQQGRISRLQDQLHGAVSQYDVKHIKRYQYIPYTAMEVDSTALSALIANPLVISVEEDIPVPPTLTESVPLIKADQAWASGYTGAGWTVAILDTGVDKTHSFFSGGKVVSEACYSTTSAASSSTTVCPNGLSSQTGSGAGVNCSGTITGCDHGTHVAGIAAGKGGSINGVAKDASIIAIQVFSRFTGATCTDSGVASPCARTFTSDQISALERVYSLRTTYHIASVNMSLGGGRNYSACDSDSRKAAIDNLRWAGIATVISSGNDGFCSGISTPACISTAVSVGATTKSGGEASYNNFHPTMLSLFAPGSSITSSIPGGGWGSKNGTSMAAPHVTGAWAILKQRSPTASVTDILNNLKNTGVLVTTGCGTGVQIPRIDVLAALPPNPPSGLSGSASSASVIALNWTDNSSNETGFKIERKTGVSGTYSQIATVGANVTTYSNTGLSEGTTYYYRVRAYNLVENSSYSSEVSATTLPAAPSGLSASAASTSQIDLIWTDNSGVEAGFRIERKTTAGGTYSEIATVAANTTKYSDTGLGASATYYYRVRAYIASGNSSYSNEIGAATPAPPSGGGGCFIATAAFGSPLEKHVEILRDFRERVLLTSSAGKVFVDFYYKASPALADKIAPSEGLRFITRVMLMPVIGVAYLIVHLGMLMTMLLFTTIVLTVIFTIVTLRRKFRKCARAKAAA
jgi:subtilisin